MSDVATQEPDSIAHKRMQLKIKRDEKELEDLLKGVTGEAEPEEVKEEVQAESKDEPKQESVDTKSESEETPKEEIEPEPKTQEEKTFKKRYGDLRRHSKNLYKSKITSISSKNPVWISDTSTALSAIEIMNTLKITSLLVAKNKDINKKIKKVIGVLHLHHCLNKGIK